MSSKRKAKTKKQEAAEDGMDPEGDAGASPPKASKRTKKASGPEGPEEVGNGWVLQPPSLIFRKGSQKGNKKIAAFDLDDTLVFPKGRRKFNLEPDEWKFFNKQVKSKLTELSEQGHKLVVFSNQGGIKKALKGKAAEKVRARVDNIIKELELDVQVFLATMDDDNRKPGVGMWELMAQQHNGGVVPDVSKCFFVGDAAGRPQDFAATDKEFAEAIGIEFKTPDDVFGKPSKVVKQDVQTKEENTLNSDVVEALGDLVQAIQEHSTSDKKGFKIAAFNKAIAAISRFDKRITKSNLKELGALQGVGKGTIAKVDEFLTTGKIAEVEELMGEDAAEDLRKAKAAEAKVKSGAMKFL